MNRIYQQYQGSGLAVLGIAIHFERDKVDKIIHAEHLDWPQIYDGLDWRSPLYRSFGGPQVPGSILIDRQGVVRKIFPKVTVDGHADELLAALDEVD